MSTDITILTDSVAEALALFRDEMKQQLETNGINASGKLDDSVTDIVITSDGFISGSVQALSYWYYTNYGRGPTIRGAKGKGVVKAKIRQWIDDKGIEPKEDANGQKVTKDELAFLIARKIHRQGYEGKLYIEEVITKVQPLVDAIVTRAADEFMDEALT